jgi:BirA family biotin operon repressor/biotin-[acetyl-CoA-carboxylase] ligase
MKSKPPLKPDRLSSSAITAGLKTRFIGQRTLYYPSLTSTMELARKEARLGAAEGTLIVAGEQTAGRGRLNRAWLSPRGNIALSLILRPKIEHLHSIIMLASLAVVHTIETVTGLNAYLKWPNDVLIGGKKICGILIESQVQENRVDYVIVGIGINVNMKPADFPDISPTATSLSDELGRQIPRLNLIQTLLLEIEKLYLAVSTGNSIFEEWRDRLVTLGRRVQVVSGASVQDGTAESVDREGHLLLRCPDGSLVKVLSGDVTLRDFSENRPSSR